MEDINTADAQNRKLPFQFHGDGSEYFKIWIVNIMLTIVTFGIYSAWATVRNNRYFYSNLELDNSRFQYLADPMTILKGRLIAVAAFIAYSVVAGLNTVLGAIILVALFFAIPYFINQSISFGNRMTGYKNIQFRFKGSYGEAFMVFYVWPILGALTLGILYPMALLKLNQYTVKNSSYGTSKFDFDATYGDYGKIILIGIGLFIVLAIPAGIVAAVASPLSMGTYFFMIVAYLVVILYFLVSMGNLYYRSLSLLDHRFEATLSIGAYAKVMLINLFLTIITFGLYLPAAKVRMTKYVCSCIVMHSVGSLDNFAAAEQENITALGEEFGQVFDFGI